MLHISYIIVILYHMLCYVMLFFDKVWLGKVVRCINNITVAVVSSSNLCYYVLINYIIVCCIKISYRGKMTCRLLSHV